MRKKLVAGCCVALIAGMAQAQTTTQTQTTRDAIGNTTSSVTTVVSGPAATLAQAQAQSAQITATTAQLPPSGISQSTTNGTGSGTEEASLFVAAASRVAADYIHTKVKGNVLIFVGGPSTNAPDTSPWLAFKSQTTRFKDDLDLRTKQLKGYLTLIDPKPVVGGEQHQFVAIAGAALIPLAMNLLSWANNSIQTGGMALTPDDYLMDVALLAPSGQDQWMLFSQTPSMDTPQEVKDALTAIDTSAWNAVQEIAHAQVEITKLSANSDDAKKDPKATQIAIINSYITALNADITGYQSFLAGLGGSTGLNWPAVLGAYRYDSALAENGSGAIFVKVHSAAAGTYTKSNLFTSFGTTPLYVSTAMVVSYVYYPPAKVPDGGGTAVLGPPNAQTFEVATKYQKIKDVYKTLKLEAAGNCPPGGPSSSVPDAVDFCPIVYVRAK